MPQYWTPSGLAAIAQTESSGNPTAHDPTSSASGLYGFLDSTWASFAPKAGIDLNQYPTAASAPSSVQTAVASITPISNWTCPGCNSAASGIAGQLGNVTDSPLVTVGLFDQPAANNNFSISGLPFTNTVFSDPNSVPGPSGQGAPNPYSNNPLVLNPDVSGTGLPNSPFLHPDQTFQPGSIPGVNGNNSGVTNGNGDSFSFNDPNSGGITTGDNANNYSFFGLQPLGNTDPLANQTTAQDYGAFGLSPLPSSLGDYFNQINPLITGSNSAGSASGNTFYQGVLNNVKDFIVRFGLILLAIALIAVAAWALSKGGLQKQAARLMEA